MDDDSPVFCAGIHKHSHAWQRQAAEYAILDLYCGAGGAAKGYADAGFAVTGVDVKPQPEYPYRFIRADALDLPEMLLEWIFGGVFDAIHASPPCQAYSRLNAYNHKQYPDLIGPTRELLRASDLPYVIENVEDARRELVDPVKLCGPVFGLKMYRHRYFEAGGFTICQPPHPAHEWKCTRNSYLPTPERPFMSIHGGKHSHAWQRQAAEYMGTPWISTIKGVCDAIPPAYTQHVGGCLFLHLNATQQPGAAA